jgi:NADPH2:quinone reductase
MRAWVLERPDGPDGLALTERPSPAPGPWEVRIAVRASALNRADLLQMRGLYPAPPGAPPDVCGLEYAGEVTRAGAQVSLFRPGDRVMGLVGSGAFAEELVVHEREALPLPAHLSFAEGAALPEAFLTAWDALVLQGHLRSGEWALVHAAASGVGTAAVQLVRALGGRVVGTSRTEEKLRRLTRDFGMDAALLPGSPPSFAAQVREATCGRGADVALELVGGGYLPETCAAMAPRGRVMLVGLLAGSNAALDLRAVLSRRLVIKGTVLRSRPLEEKLHLAQAAVRHLVPLFESRALRPVVDEVVAMGELKRACARLAANDAFGKIVLHW